MMNQIKSYEIISLIKEIIPNPQCELNFFDNFSLLCAVMLSAQTTDKRVNEVTKVLFIKYPNCKMLKEAEYSDVYNIIKPLGLAKVKTNNLINLATIIFDKYNGIVPNDFNELITLPGIGRKTANVVLALGFKFPTFPVDTHIFRVSKRLGYIKKNDNILECEIKLKKYVKEEDWITCHHLFLLFGRYYCKALNPSCNNCKLKIYCKKARIDKS